MLSVLTHAGGVIFEKIYINGYSNIMEFCLIFFCIFEYLDFLIFFQIFQITYKEKWGVEFVIVNNGNLFCKDYSKL